MADAAIERYVYDLPDGSGLDDVALEFLDSDGNGAQPLALKYRYLHGPAVDQVLAQEDVTQTMGTAGRVLWQATEHATRACRERSGVLVGVTPIVGEVSDIIVIFGEDSTVLERLLASGSLLVSILTLGTSPNAGAVLRSGDNVLGVGDDLADALRLAPNRNPLDEIARFRAKSNLTDGDTLARVEVNGRGYFGVNSGASPDSLALRKEFLEQIQTKLGKLEGKQLNRVRALTHAESHALMRAYVRTGGNLGDELVIHVDRITCNFCSGENGVTLFRELMGVKKITIISPGSTVTLP